VELKLPTGVVSQVDTARLIRELNSLEDFFTAANARHAGTPMTPPRLTRMLDALAKDNNCNLLDQAQRQKLVGQLDQVLKTAPLLQVSFATEPPPRILEQILVWLRSNIHPQTLLQVGLQPTIAAGCMLRTPNKVFDMSLRSHLREQESYLVKLIAGAVHGQ
jgi:F0F1-type ATP synthase delta subunit